MKLNFTIILLAFLSCFAPRAEAQSGSALNFDGSDDYISFSNDLSSVTNFTYEAWVNVHDSYAWERILDFGNGPEYNIVLTTSFGGTLQPMFAIKTGSGDQTVTAPEPIALNTWTHIAVTLDGATATMYINGVMVAQNTSFSYTPSSIGATVQNYIGKSQYDDPYYNGDIDEVRMWNVTRTQAQIVANMNCDVAAQTGLIAYYRFDEGTADGDNTHVPKVYDYSGNGNCGTFNFMSLSGSSNSNYIAGAVSSCHPISVPNAGTISGNVPVCPGNSITLSPTTTGGLWISADTSKVVVSAGGVVTAIAPGLTSVTYRSGCVQTVVQVTVNALPVQGGSIYTFAGTGGIVNFADGGTATASDLAGPIAAVTDHAGNVYIADLLDNRVRKISPAGIITTFAGTRVAGHDGDGGPATAAQLGGPAALAMDNAGNMYISENGGSFIRKVSPSGIISTIAGTGVAGYSGDGLPATDAQLNGPVGVVADASGNVYIADYSNHAIRKIDAAGIITTFAGVPETLGFDGDGVATAHMLSYPSNMIVDASGNLVFTDAGNNRVRMVSPSGMLTTLAGTGALLNSGDGGPAADADILTPFGISQSNGNIYVSSISGYVIRKIDAAGIITTIAGNATSGNGGDGGPATAAQFTTPYGVHADENGNVYVCDVFSRKVRKVYGPDVIAGATELCTGATAAITTNNTGGVWSSSNTSVASIGSTGIVTGIGTGVATISYTVSGICANKYLTTMVTVNAGAAAIAGPSSFAVGSFANYTSATSGGVWSSSNTARLTIDSATGAATAVANGSVVVTYTLPGGCFRSKAVTIGGAAIAPITGNLSLCVGVPGVLSSASAPGLSWASNNTSVATVGSSSGVVTPLTAGTTIITFTASSGVSVTAVATVNPAPDAIGGPLVACPGATAALISASTGGTWVSSDLARASVGSASGIVTGISAGTSIITYTLPTGCKTIAVVTINPIPSAITGAAAICVGSTSALATTATGGNWASDNSSIASVNASGVVTGNSIGITNVFYALGSGCAASVTVTVSAIAAITGNANMCLGTATTLSHAISGGTWLSGNTAVATVSGGVVTGIATGTANITYTVSGGCRTATTVTVNPTLPNIAGPSTVCENSTITLTNATSGGTWTTASSQASVHATTGVVSGITAGTAVITYSVATGCSKTYVVTVKPLPSAISGASSVCVGTTTAFTNATTGGLSWTSSSPANATINGAGIVTGIAAGTATITYTLSSGCATSRDITINASPAAITGNSNVCVGATTTLSSASSGGTWASNSISVATIGSADGIVTGIAASSTTITYYVNGCKTIRNIVVNNQPAAIGGSLAICQGATTMLSSATAGGTWSTSAAGTATVGTTGLVTGLSAGNTTISYTMSNGCARAAEVTVSALPAITGSTTICNGSSTTLSATTPGGTWSSSAAAVATISSATGVLTGMSNGVATITYALSASCKSTAAITVVAGPAAIVGAAAVCQGSTTTFSDASGPGIWSTSNPGIATVNSAGLVTGISAGSATITFATGTSCYRVKSITVGSGSASLSGASALCVGGTTIYTSVSPATGESWTSSNPSVATIGVSSGLVTGIAAGTTIVTFTPYTTSAYAGCIATRVLTVDAAPAVSSITGPSSVSVGHTITLANATPAGVWSSSNTAKATVSAGGVVTGVAGSAATISYTVTNGGCNISATKAITIANSKAPAANELNNSSVAVFPNPTTGAFTIVTSVGGSVIIYTLEGKELMQQPIVSGSNAVQLPQGIAAGIYMCRINGTDGSSTMVRLIYAQ